MRENNGQQLMLIVQKVAQLYMRYWKLLLLPAHIDCKRERGGNIIIESFECAILVSVPY